VPATTAIAERAAYAYIRHVPDIWSATAGLRSVPGSGSGLYALVDVAQSRTFAPALARRRSSWPQRRIFEGRFSGAVEAWSPVLLEIPGGDAGPPAMNELSNLCEDFPALGFIASHEGIDALAAHLQDRLLLQTADGLAFLLRLADTQALSAAFVAATPAQQACLLGKVGGWWTVDPQGRLFELHAACPADAPAEPPPLTFQAAQMDTLLEASAVPITAAQLRQRDPGFAARRLAEQHHFVGCMAQQARQAGFGTADDLLAWCTAALRAGGGFASHPLVGLALVDAALDTSPQRLATAFGTLDETTWDEVAAPPQPAPEAKPPEPSTHSIQGPNRGTMAV